MSQVVVESRIGKSKDSTTIKTSNCRSSKCVVKPGKDYYRDRKQCSHQRGRKVELLKLTFPIVGAATR